MEKLESNQLFFTINLFLELVDFSIFFLVSIL